MNLSMLECALLMVNEGAHADFMDAARDVLGAEFNATVAAATLSKLVELHLIDRDSHGVLYASVRGRRALRETMDAWGQLHNTYLLRRK